MSKALGLVNLDPDNLSCFENGSQKCTIVFKPFDDHTHLTLGPFEYQTLVQQLDVHCTTVSIRIPNRPVFEWSLSDTFWVRLSNGPDIECPGPVIFVRLFFRLG